MADAEISAPVCGAQVELIQMIACEDCGARELRKNNSHRFCSSCAAQRTRDSTYRSHAKRKDEIAAYRTAWLAENRESQNEKRRAARLADPEAAREADRLKYERNKEKKRAQARSRYERKREAILASRRTDEYRAYDAKIKKEKRSTDPGLRLHWNISRAIRLSIQNKNNRSWQSVLGYTLEELIAHLEKQFQPGMSWDNYGKYGWHIDHKKPRAAFRFESDEDPDFIECWALDNLQPLWAEDNHKKTDKFNGSPTGLARDLHA